MKPELALELFGYLGTALVLISFIYAICTNTTPVAVLNGSLIFINSIQLFRILRKERKALAAVNTNSTTAYDIKENEKEETK